MNWDDQATIQPMIAAHSMTPTIIEGSIHHPDGHRLSRCMTCGPVVSSSVGNAVLRKESNAHASLLVLEAGTLE